MVQNVVEGLSTNLPLKKVTFFQNKDAAISLADIKYLIVKASKKELSLNHREMAVNGLFNNYKKASDLT